MNSQDLLNKIPLESLRIRLRQTEQELRLIKAKHERSERVLEAIRGTFYQLPAAFAVIAEDEGIVYANEATKKMLGVSSLEGLSYSTTLYGSDGGPDNCPVKRAFRTGQEQGGQIELATGEKRQCISRPITLADGRNATISLFLPPTFQEAREVQEDRAARAVGEMISQIAGDINSPLTAVIGFSEILALQCADAKNSDIIQKILTEAIRCKHIMASLLAFSRKHPSRRARVNPNDLVREAIDIKRYELDESSIELEFDTGTDSSKTIGDPHLLRQVFVNVIDNARHQMARKGSHGPLTISTTTDAETISIRFADAGTGAPSGSMRRADSLTGQPRPNGEADLGLSFSSKIVRRHGGKVTINGAEDERDSVTVTLPRVEAIEKATEKESIGALYGANGKILVVDSDETVLDLLTEVFGAQLRSVTPARTVDDALGALSRDQYDCIICDIKIPEINDKGLYDLIKALDPEMSQRLIFTTSDNLTSSTWRFVKDSGIPFVQKPFGAEEITAIAQSVMAKTGEKSAEEAPRFLEEPSRQSPESHLT